MIDLTKPLHRCCSLHLLARSTALVRYMACLNILIKKVAWWIRELSVFRSVIILFFSSLSRKTLTFIILQQNYKYFNMWPKLCFCLCFIIESCLFSIPTISLEIRLGSHIHLVLFVQPWETLVRGLVSIRDLPISCSDALPRITLGLSSTLDHHDRHRYCRGHCHFHTDCQHNHHDWIG